MAGRAARHKDINFCKANKENSGILQYVINNCLITCSSTDPWKRWGSLSLTHTRCTTHARSRIYGHDIHIHHIHTTHTHKLLSAYIHLQWSFSFQPVHYWIPLHVFTKIDSFSFVSLCLFFFYSMYNVSMRFNVRVCIFMNVAYIWACYLCARVCVSYTSYSCSSLSGFFSIEQGTTTFIIYCHFPRLL